MAVYQRKTLKRARPTTRKLMEQANALQTALVAIKRLIPQVAQIEDDFAHSIIEDIHAQYMKEAKRSKPSIFSDSDNPCWRCAHVPTELIAEMAQTPERLNELFPTSPTA